MSVSDVGIPSTITFPSVYQSTSPPSNVPVASVATNALMPTPATRKPLNSPIARHAASAIASAAPIGSPDLLVSPVTRMAATPSTAPTERSN